MADELSDLHEFEEVERVSVGQRGSPVNAGQQGQTGEQRKGSRPDFRVVQPDKDQNGQTLFRSIGAMWKSQSKSGKEFYVMKIGELRLLVFPNNKE